MNNKEFYKKVVFNIVNTLIGRETVFLGKTLAVRCIKAHSVKFLGMNFDRFNFHDKKLNLYYSLARYESMPMLSFNRKDRKTQREDFNKTYRQFLVGFDYGLDFDNHDKTVESFYTCYDDTKKVKQLFDEYKIPYELKCSGTGFHININYNTIKQSIIGDDIDNIILFYQKLVTYLKIVFNLESLDNSIMDERRIWKAPYSIDYKSGNVALPLTDEQFKNFTFDIVKPENVCKLKLFKRGNLERIGTVTGFNKFLKDYVVDNNE